MCRLCVGLSSGKCRPRTVGDPHDFTPKASAHHPSKFVDDALRAAVIEAVREGIHLEPGKLPRTRVKGKGHSKVTISLQQIAT